MNRVEGKQPVSLVYKDGEFIGEYDWRLCCGNPTADGGIMPQPFDPVPAGRPDALRTSGGTRHMKHGPAHKPHDPYEAVPVGGPPAARHLYQRRDVPWTGTGKGKIFSTPEYTPDAGRPRDIATAPAALPPMRAGRPQLSATSYEHLADPPANAAAPFRPALKAGKAPDHFDGGVHNGPAAVPASPPKGPRPKVPRPNTNMKKRDTFGAYPKHMSDPYLDDPIKELDDRGRRWAKGRRNVLTCICRGGPTIPIVNVWDHPACLQTKAGVVSGKNPVTGESMTFINDKGRFGSTA